MTGGSGLYIDAVRFGIDDLPEVDKEIRASASRNNWMRRAWEACVMP